MKYVLFNNDAIWVFKGWRLYFVKARMIKMFFPLLKTPSSRKQKLDLFFNLKSYYWDALYVIYVKINYLNWLNLYHDYH